MSRTEQKEQTKQKILEAAGRGFRKCGYGGAGVDALAREAGVTSGAFYVHFESKAAAFREALSQGVASVDRTIRRLQEDHPRSWWRDFVEFYLGPRRRSELAESCGLQSLASEVARADAPSREAFEAELRTVARTIASGPACPGAPRDLESACAALATLVGTVTLARAIPTASLADRIAAAAARAMLPTARKAPARKSVGVKTTAAGRAPRSARARKA